MVLNESHICFLLPVTLQHGYGTTEFLLSLNQKTKSDDDHAPHHSLENNNRSYGLSLSPD